jgi:uncharacterized protein
MHNPAPLTPYATSYYYSPLMSKDLPARVHPLRLAHHGETLAGSVSPTQMPRLASMLYQDCGQNDGQNDGQNNGVAEFELRFGHDDNAQACVLGHIDAALVVLCQRCLEPMSIHVRREVQLALVRSDDEAAALNAEYDPMLVGEEPISLVGLVEDEIILAMPNFSRHGSGECRMPSGADTVNVSADDGQAHGSRHGDSAGESGKDNPFSILESIKTRKTP